MANITIRSNSAQVNPNFGQHVTPSVNTAGIEANARAIGAMGNVIGGIRAEIDKHREQQEALRIMNATNAVNLQLGELRSDMEKNMQGSNGVNAQEYFNTQAAKIVNDAYAKSGIRYKVGENAFRKAVGSTVTQGSVWARNFQNRQQDVVNMTSFDLLVDNSITDVMQGGSLRDNLDKVDFFMRSALNYKPEEQLEQIRKATNDKIAGALVQDAITHNDYLRGGQILSEFGSDISSQIKLRLGNSLYKNQEYTENRSIAKTVTDMCYGKNMTDDEKRELIRQNAQVPEGTVRFKQGVSFDNLKPNTTAGMKALAGFFESRGIDFIVTSANEGYAGHASGARSHGAGAKADWASDALEKMTKQERESLFREAENLFGITINNEIDNPSPNSTGAHIDVDFTDFNKSGMSEMRVDQVLGQVKSEEAYRARQDAIYQDNLVKDAINTLFTMQQQGASYEEAESWARNEANGDATKYDKLMSSANHMYGGRGRSTTAGQTGGTNKLSMDEERDLEFKIDNGRMPQEELQKYLADRNINPSDSQKWINRNDKARRGEGEYSYNWSGLISAVRERMGKGKVSDEDAMSLVEYAKEVVRGYIEKNNRLPSTDYILDEMQKALTKGKYGGINAPGLIFSTPYREIDLRNHGIWKAELEKDANDRETGNVIVYRYGDLEPVVLTGKEFNAEMESKVK